MYPPHTSTNDIYVTIKKHMQPSRFCFCPKFHMENRQPWQESSDRVSLLSSEDQEKYRVQDFNHR